MESLVLFPIRPTSKQRNDKEKMIKYYMAQQKAKQRLTQYQRYMKEVKCCCWNWIDFWLIDG